MKLRFGIDIEVVHRASITDRAASIVNKVASLKKNLDEEAAGLIAAARGEPDSNKQKGNNYFAFFSCSLFCVQQIYFERKIINCIV